MDARVESGPIKLASLRTTSVKDVAPLENGRMKQADQLTINASFAPLENGPIKLVSLRTNNVKDVAQLVNGRMKQVSLP